MMSCDGQRLGRGRERVVGGDDEDEFELPHRLNRQRPFGWRFPGRPDHQVGAPGHQRVPASTQNFGRYLDARAGTFPVKVLQKRERGARWE